MILKDFNRSHCLDGLSTELQSTVRRDNASLNGASELEPSRLFVRNSNSRIGKLPLSEQCGACRPGLLGAVNFLRSEPNHVELESTSPDTGPDVV